MPLEGLEEEGLPKIPDLRLVQLKFLLTVDDSLGIDKDDVWKKLKKEIIENSMAPFYSWMCTDLGRPVDSALLTKMEEENKAELARLEEAIEDAEKNFGETERKDALMAKAEYLCKIGDKDGAVSTYRAAYDKTVGLSHRMDISFYLIRLGLFFMDHDLITRNIDKAKSLIEEGGDWDRRNRLKTYEGLYAMSIRDFKKAAVCFFDTMATFTSTELMDYQTFSKYSIISCLIAQDRKDIKKQVISGSDILEVLHDFPELSQHVKSFYNCQYDQFFRSLLWAEKELLCDRYLAPHAYYYIREMRVKAYAQLLQSYRSLALSYMAKSFGVSIEFMDRELSKFIASGRLHCRIDKVGGVVETNRPDSKNFLYQSTIKQGDLLLNRIQKLSRVTNI